MSDQIIPTEKVRHFSYSRSEKDSTCARARFLASEWGDGIGLEAVDTGWDRGYGNIIHKFLRNLAVEGKIDYVEVRRYVLEMAHQAGLDHIHSRDWAAIAEGQLRGFQRYLWPYWMKEYEILESEKLRRWMVEPGFEFLHIQDLLLKSKIDGHLRYPDYKTTSSDDTKWVAGWARHPQIHSSLYAIKQQGVDVRDAIVCGLYKGYRDRKTGVQRSIYSYGYVNREFSITPEYSYEYKRGKGWELFSVYEEFPDLEQWVAKMPEHIISAQYPTTGPIFLNEHVAKAWFRQQLMREKDVKVALGYLRTIGMHNGPIEQKLEQIQEVMDYHFPQDFTKCKPSWGFECDFNYLCWQPWVEADPVASGLYKPRERDMPVESE